MKIKLRRLFRIRAYPHQDIQAGTSQIFEFFFGKLNYNIGER